MRQGLRALAITLLLLVGLLCMFPAHVAYAATHTIVVTPSSDTVSCNTAGDEYHISGEGSGHAVSISGGSASNPVRVTLDNFSVDASGSRGDGNAPVQVSGYCILTLEGTNSLKSGWHEITLKKDEGIAALRVMNGATCIIEGEGSLYAECTHNDRGGAGIGSNYNEDTGAIIINSGTIEAHGGHCGAGIGSGRDGVCTNVTINGGTVTAYGGEYAAGIGGGDHAGSGSGGNVDSISINGGTINAYGGDNGGAGIGGSEGGDVGTIRITGGTIKARGCGRNGEKGDGNAAGIGGGDGGAATITIDQTEGTPLSIDALGGWSGSHGGAGIGSANCTSKDISIYLRGGTITAEGGEKAAGIGGGNKQSGKIIIDGYGTINATAGRDACAIGAGQQCHSGVITIQGSGPETGTCGYPLLIRAYGGSTRDGGQNGALIGSGDGSAGNISIRGAYVSLAPTAGGSLYGAGIGTGCSNDLSIQDGGIRKIEIRNATVHVSSNGRMYGAGIGAGYNSNIDDITLESVTYTGPTIGTSCGNRVVTNANNMNLISIANSTITAAAEDHGDPWAGIGTGPYGAIDSISIANSNVEARGACGGAGIGTGGLEMTGFDLEAAVSDAGKCGNIELAGGTGKTITAIGSGSGAGIGGGQLTSVEGSIRVSGYTVVARSGSDGGAGIGGGSACSANDITISGAHVTAMGGKASAGIGSSGFDDTSWISGIVESTWNTVCGNVTIQNGSDVEATGGTGGAGIGLGQGAQQKSGTWLKIDGSTVKATGGEGAAGIGAGSESGLGRGAEGRRISITGKSKVEAHGGSGGAGIGGGYQGGLESCTIALTDYYNTSSSPLPEGASAYVKAYGGDGAAGIGGGASSHDAGNKGTLDGGHDAKSITISGGFVAAYGGNGSDSRDGAGASGPGAGIGGGSHQGDLEGFTVTGGVIIARAGRKAGLSGAISAQDIGHGGTRSGEGTGGDGSDSIAIQDGTVVADINKHEVVRVSGGSVEYTFPSQGAKNYPSQGDQYVYQTSFKVDTDSLPSTTFEGMTFYKLSNMSTSAAYYGCDHIFARKVGEDEDHRAQVWLYLPESATDAATADFRINTNTTSASTNRHYYGTTTAGKPLDFSTNETANTNVLKMAAPIVLEPDASTPPYAGQDYTLNVHDTSHALPAGTELTYTATNGTLQQTSGTLSSGSARIDIKVASDAANQPLRVTATVGDNPKADLFWGTTATYSAMIDVIPLSVKIISDISRTYNNTPVGTPTTSTTPDDIPVTFTYTGDNAPNAPVEPGTYTVTATVARGSEPNVETASDTRTFTIGKYQAMMHIDVSDQYYTGDPVKPTFTVTAKEEEPAQPYNATGNGEIVVKYDVRTSNGWNHLDGPPAEAGSYRVKAYAKEDSYYKSSNTVTAYFSIFEVPPRTDPYLFVDMPESTVYDMHVVDDPLVWTNSDGEVSYTYYEGDDPVESSRLVGAPKDAGTYTVVVSVSETSRYNAVSATRTFTIKPRPAMLRIDAVGDERREGASVQVALVGGLSDVVGEEVQLVSKKDGDSSSVTQDAALAERRDALIATYSFPSVAAGTYELTAHFADNNYAVADAFRTFEKSEKPSYSIVAQDEEKTFGDDPFTLTVEVFDGEGEDVQRDVSFTLLDASDNAMLDNNVLQLDDQGVVTILQAGTSAVRTTVAEDETCHGDTDYALVVVQRAELPLELDVQDKVYDGNPVEASYVVKDEAFPVRYEGTDTLVVRFFRLVQSADVDGEGVDTESDTAAADTVQALDSAPVDPGRYVALVTAPGDRNYEGTAVWKRFSITMPDEPDDPDTPDTPDKPDTPDVPDEPDKPEMPAESTPTPDSGSKPASKTSSSTQASRTQIPNTGDASTPGAGISLLLGCLGCFLIWRETKGSTPFVSPRKHE